MSQVDISNQNVVVEEGDKLAKITWFTEDNYKYVWLENEEIYDMMKVEEGYQLIIEKDKLDEMRIVTINK